MVSNHFASDKRDAERGEASGRRRLAFISLAGFLATVPHVVEDFVYGVPQKYGVGLSAAGMLVAAGYFIQAYGIILLIEGKRAGSWISLMIGGAWLAGALWDHLADLVSAEPYRQGAVSRLWIAGVLLWSAALASAALLSIYSSFRRKKTT